MIYKEKILENIVKNFFDTFIIKDGDILLVALSGGMDSMVMLDAFYKLQSEIDYKLMAIHVHHGIRGDEADRDLQFVKKYCKSIDIKLFTDKVDAISFAKKKYLSLEEAARILRYDSINEVWKKLSVKHPKNNVYVLVAHHEKDQVETIIHNIIRGTGIKGFAGINKLNGYILRPLLDVSKENIEKYSKSYDVPYVNDSTNDDINYTRNYIRKEIIDKFEKINNKACEHIVELARQAREANDYIDKKSKEAFAKVLDNASKDKIVLDLKMFRENDEIIKIGIIKIVFDNLLNTLKDITNININDILVLSDKSKGGHLDLPYNIVVDKKQNSLSFTKTTKNLSMSRRKKK